MLVEPPRGMDDLLPDEMALKRRIEDVIREVYALYGYLEVETPTVEHYELFEAKSGEEIRERMFDFKDKAGRRLVLRPEVTASIARLVSTKLKASPLPLRLGYIADCYRYDEPQWGRRRRFWQGGFELFGSSSPLADAEILQASYEVFKRIGIRGQFFKVGHVGILRSILASYNVGERVQDRVLTLIDRERLDEAWEELKRIGGDDEVVRAVEEAVSLPPITRGGGEASRVKDVLSPWPEALSAFENLMEIVELAVEGGVEAEIKVYPGMARGLEYYTGFVFEHGAPGANVSLNGGGRYDKLVELFGGKPTPAVGCAIGITRIMHYLLGKGEVEVKPRRPVVMITSAPEVSARYIARAVYTVRKLGIPLEVEVLGRRVPAAIEYAVKNGFKFLIIVGGKEEAEETISIRNLERKEQVQVPLKNSEEIRRILSEEVG